MPMRPRAWASILTVSAVGVAKFSAEDGLAPTGDGAMAAELRRLRKENARLLMERDILKKAAQFFAKEQP